MNEPWWTNPGQFRAFPYMWILHAEMIRKAIPDDPCVVTEWGMGGSTLWFLQILPRGSTLFSLEHNRKWFEMVRNAYRKMLDAGLIDPTIIFYPECITEFDPPPSILRPAHLMLIDCEHDRRAPILDMVDEKKLLLPNGDVFLHDAQRPEYQSAIDRFVRLRTVGHRAALPGNAWIARDTDPSGVGMWHGRRKA